MKTPVYILYAQGHSERGSVIMRAMQLAEIANQYLHDRFEFRTVGMPRRNIGAQLPHVSQIRDGIVILQKALAEFIDAEAFDDLKTNNIAMMVDWIDKKPKSPFLEQFDVHLAASHFQEEDLKQRFPTSRVRYLTHHADPRLAPNTATSFKAIYLGHANNSTVLDSPDLTIADVRTEADFLAHLRSLVGYSMHYAVRDDKEWPGIFKPFTKGFTAAACEANIIVQRDAHDVSHYLEADYPYLVDDTKPETLRAMFDHARESYGGPEWDYGLDIMADVRERSCPRAVAHELGQILTDIVGSKRGSAARGVA